MHYKGSAQQDDYHAAHQRVPVCQQTRLKMPLFYQVRKHQPKTPAPPFIKNLTGELGQCYGCTRTLRQRRRSQIKA
jgi:hypothetical protein